LTIFTIAINVNTGMCVISQRLIVNCLNLLPVTMTMLHRSERQRRCPISSRVQVIDNYLNSLVYCRFQYLDPNFWSSVLVTSLTTFQVHENHSQTINCLIRSCNIRNQPYPCWYTSPHRMLGPRLVSSILHICL